jgi:hypothetical protein
MNARELLARYVEQHDARRWDDVAQLFAEDAVLAFVGPFVGPFIGREAIADGYREHPPEDRIVVLAVEEDENAVEVRWAWASSPKTQAGTLRLVEAAGEIAALVVRVGA